MLHASSRPLRYRGRRPRDEAPVILELLGAERPSFSELLLQLRNQYTIARSLPLPGVVSPLALERRHNGFAIIMADEG